VEMQKGSVRVGFRRGPPGKPGLLKRRQAAALHMSRD